MDETLRQAFTDKKDISVKFKGHILGIFNQYQKIETLGLQLWKYFIYLVTMP